MKSKVLSLMLVGLATLTTSYSQSARAEDGKVTSILYSCNLSFRATGRSVYLGVGYTDVHGKGTISCYDLLTGATQHLPIKVKARGPGAGLGITGLVMSGAATGVGVTKGPESLLGHYVTVRGNAAAGVGVGAGISFRLSNGAATVDVGVEAQTGLGAGIDLLWVDIEADGEPRVEAGAPVAPPQAPVVAAPTPAPVQEPVKVSPTQVIYLSEGQPLQIVNKHGEVVQTIYLKPASLIR